MTKALRRPFQLGFLEFDMADEFRRIVLRIEGRAIAAQGLLIEDAHHATGGHDRTASGLAAGAIRDQALQPLAGRSFAETFRDDAALENHQRAPFGRRRIHARRAQAQTAGERLDEVELSHDVGEDGESVPLGRRTPTPAFAGEIVGRRGRLDDADALGGAPRGDHRAVRARENGPRLAGAEGLDLDDIHVPHARVGGRVHELGGSLPDLLGLFVFGEAGERTPDDLPEGDIFLLRHGSHGQEEAEKDGSHGPMTPSGDGLSSDYALATRGNGRSATKAGISAEGSTSPTTSG